MKHIFALLIGLAIASPALAADTLTITLVSDSPTWSGTASKTWTFTQADMTKFLAWAAYAYPNACTPTPPATTCKPTTPQVLLAWANGFLSGTKSNVINWQQQSAASTAISGVVPINPQ